MTLSNIHPDDVKAANILGRDLCDRYQGDSYTVQTFQTTDALGWPDGWYEFVVHIHCGQEIIAGTLVHCLDLDTD